LYRTEKILKDSAVAVAPPARSVQKGGAAITSASSAVGKPLTRKRIAEVVEDENESDGSGEEDGDEDEEGRKAEDAENEDEEEEGGDVEEEEGKGDDEESEEEEEKEEEKKGDDVEEEEKDEGMDVIIEDAKGESDLNFITLIYSNNY
jgi:cobalamin biosynthesis protein CobT